MLRKFPSSLRDEGAMSSSIHNIFNQRFFLNVYFDMWCSLFLWNINTGSLAHWLSIVSVVNMVDWSIISVLDPSVAHGHSHELVALVVLAFDHIWELLLGFLELVHLFDSDGRNDVVGTDLLGNLTEVGVLVHGMLFDWDDGFDYIPQDTLDKRSGGERALVSESSVEVDELNELAQVHGTEFQVLHLRSPLTVKMFLPLVVSVELLEKNLLMELLINKGGQELVMI